MRLYRERIYATYVTDKMSFVRDYDEASYRNFATTYRKYCGHLLPNDRESRILDVGCGHGNFLYFLQCSGYKNIWGIDISPEQVERARRICPNVEVGDALEFLGNHPDSFDFISALDFIEHLDKDEVFRFLDNIMVALKKGGSILLQTVNAESPFGSQHRYNDFTHEVGFTPNSLCDVLRISGFEKCRVYPCGPVPKGIMSTVRWLLWQGFVLAIRFYNVVETGSPGSGIFTRIMLCTASKP